MLAARFGMFTRKKMHPGAINPFGRTWSTMWVLLRLQSQKRRPDESFLSAAKRHRIFIPLKMIIETKVDQKLDLNPRGLENNAWHSRYGQGKIILLDIRLKMHSGNTYGKDSKKLL